MPTTGGRSRCARKLRRTAPPNHWRVSMNELRVRDLFDIDPFDDAFRGFLRPWKFERSVQAPQIKIDVTEHDANYAVKAEIPGVRKEDIDVRIDGNRVTISAEVKKEKEEKDGGRVLRSEREYGYASRTFTLGSAVDDSKSDAKYNNGVLELVLPKKAAASTKRLTVG
jgi:HSP20 family protein